MAQLRLGTSGWSYTDWVGNFYPRDARPIQFLSLYAARFPTVELDTTFYATPAAEVVHKWREKVPEPFLFAAKFPKLITHEKRLRHCAGEVGDFIDMMSLLEENLGPFLIQFPYGYKITEMETLAAFLERIPQGYRYAVEARHRSWFVPEFYDLLRSLNIALVLYDHPWLPRMRMITADFVYVRWLGDRSALNRDFTGPKIDQSKKLHWWSERIRQYLGAGLDVYGYFNNNFNGHAPSAIRLLEDYLADRTPGPELFPPSHLCGEAHEREKPCGETAREESADGELAHEEALPGAEIESENRSEA